MRWRDVEAGVWIIPPETAKNGREHRVPLPRPAIAILRVLPRLKGNDYVFPGRRGPMTGWSKRLPAVYAATATGGMAPWTPHDLRRTFRSGLAALGVDHVVAELMLAHVVPGGTLAPLYNRAERWLERVEAAERWAAHVDGLVSGGGDVVPLRRSARHG